MAYSKPISREEFDQANRDLLAEVQDSPNIAAAIAYAEMLNRKLWGEREKSNLDEGSKA